MILDDGKVCAVGVREVCLYACSRYDEKVHKVDGLGDPAPAPARQGQPCAFPNCSRTSQLHLRRTTTAPPHFAFTRLWDRPSTFSKPLNMNRGGKMVSVLEMHGWS